MRHVLLLAMVSCAAAALLAVGSPACMTHDCEMSDRAIPYGRGPNEGDFVYPTLWESMPLDGSWLDFAGGTSYEFHVPTWESEGRPIAYMHGYVSSAPNPNKTGDNWTEGVGNMVEYSKIGPGTVTVTNATCSPFYLRLILIPGDKPQPDAGTDAAGADAASPDATDSSADATDSSAE